MQLVKASSAQAVQHIPASNAALIWVPVIALEYLSAAGGNPADFIGFKLSRFWLAEHAPGEYVAAEWDTQDARGTGGDASFYVERGEFTLPSAIKNDVGVVVVTYCVYSVSLWNELNNLLQRIRAIRFHLDKTLRSALFSLHKGA